MNQEQAALMLAKCLMLTKNGVEIGVAFQDTSNSKENTDSKGQG